MKPRMTVCLIVVTFAAAALAQDPPTQQPKPSPAAEGATAGAAVPPQQSQQPARQQQQPPNPTPAAARVTRAWSPNDNPEVIRLRDNVFVFVTDYAQLQEESSTAAKPVTLWINGRDSKLIAEKVVETPAKDPAEYLRMQALPGNTATASADAKPMAANATANDAVRTDPKNVVLTFQLERTQDNKDLWKTLLEDPFTEQRRDVVVSIGVSGAKPIQASQAMVLEKRDSGRTTWWLFIFGIVVVLFLVVAAKTDIVRNGPPVAGGRQAYSLGRCQMAWWFFLILAGYVTIWLISGDQDTITTSLLTLMGISAGTALGAVAIDNSSDVTTRTKLLADQAEAQKKLAGIQGQIAAVAAPATVPQALRDAETTLQTRLGEIPSELAALKTPPVSQRWFLDILRDDNGTIALHRLQIVVWTIVLGLMFAASVYTTLSMPEFSGTLLALMGVSATTYIGFKLPTGG